MKKYTFPILLLATLHSCSTGNTKKHIISNNKVKTNITMKTELKTKVISIKKGQSIDFLVGVINPQTEKLREEYFGNIVPVAMQNGFKSEIQMRISEPIVEHGFKATFCGLMSWPNAKSRIGFRDDMENHSYDYLAERKKIWPIFNNIEHNDIDKDYEFSVSSDKVYVVTAYWITDQFIFSNKKRETPKNIENAGGKFLITIKDGKSPNSDYEPNYISITEWNSVAAFKTYLKTGDNSIENSGISKSSQWVTNLLF